MTDNTNSTMFTVSLKNTAKRVPEVLSQFSCKTIQNACKRAHKELAIILDLPCKSTMERICGSVMAFVYEGDKLRKTFYTSNGIVKVVNHS